MDKPPLDETQLDALRQEYQSLTSQRKGDRVDPQQLAQFISEKVPGSEREEFAERLPDSPEDLALYREMQAVHDHATEAFQSTPETISKPRLFFGLWRNALATAAIVAAAWILWPFIPGMGPTDRQSKAPLTRDYAMPMFQVEPAANTTLTTSPNRLSWPVDQHRTPSKVKLFDGSATLLWETETGQEPRVDLPESVRTQLVDGAYFWVIEFKVQDKTIRMGPFWFRMKPTT